SQPHPHPARRRRAPGRQGTDRARDRRCDRGHPARRARSRRGAAVPHPLPAGAARGRAAAPRPRFGARVPPRDDRARPRGGGGPMTVEERALMVWGLIAAAGRLALWLVLLVVVLAMYRWLMAHRRAR